MRKARAQASEKGTSEEGEAVGPDNPFSFERNRCNFSLRQKMNE